jgi:hypothetical protein
MGVHVGIADHLGWAVAVTAAADHAVVDRRRIELVEPGVSEAPIHYQRGRLDVATTAALVATVPASVVRACSASLDDLSGALPAPVVSFSLRFWPPDFQTPSPSSAACRMRPGPARSCTATYLPNSLTHAAGRSTATTPSTSRRERPTGWASGPMKSSGTAGDARPAVEEGPPRGTGRDGCRRDRLTRHRRRRLPKPLLHSMRRSTPRG